MNPPAALKAVQPRQTIFTESTDPDVEHIWMTGTIGGHKIAPTALCGFKYDGRSLNKAKDPSARKCIKCLEAAESMG